MQFTPQGHSCHTRTPPFLSATPDGYGSVTPVTPPVPSTLPVLLCFDFHSVLTLPPSLLSKDPPSWPRCGLGEQMAQPFHTPVVSLLPGLGEN